jgi:DNA-directed RNA polymerase subunit RPC12/RpoP
MKGYTDDFNELRCGRCEKTSHQFYGDKGIILCSSCWNRVIEKEKYDIIKLQRRVGGWSPK